MKRYGIPPTAYSLSYWYTKGPLTVGQHFQNAGNWCSLSKNWFLAQCEPSRAGLKMLPRSQRYFFIPIKQVRSRGRPLRSSKLQRNAEDFKMFFEKSATSCSDEKWAVWSVCTKKLNFKKGLCYFTVKF